MLWFVFMIGLIMTICGAFLMAYDDYLSIGEFNFDSEILGSCILTIGGVLAACMLFALGVGWLEMIH
jgi:hypothetical protein